MPEMTGAEAYVKALEKEGVEYIFGITGAAIIPICDELLKSKMRYVGGVHEQGSTHMADGYARVSGRPGVVQVTSGPGATNIVTGLATAQLDSSPVVALTGQVPLSMVGTDAFQEVDIMTEGLAFNTIIEHSAIYTDVASQLILASLKPLKAEEKRLADLYRIQTIFSETEEGLVSAILSTVDKAKK